jgi:N-methylhydantoinase B/oxoprolinase/acetone carboxylase alpha subunit
MLVSGGGGFGDPLERDVDLVVQDVKEGFVSVAGALEDYGVIVDPGTWRGDPSPRAERIEQTGKAAH